MKIIRVFSCRTNATPDDIDVRIAASPTFFDEADEVHISVAFTWDLRWAEWAEKQWRYVAPVKVGGPAFNEAGGDFIPGMYMRKGYVITSRGCPNSCWFCQVPKREGSQLRELPVKDGWILTDDNILACSEKHIEKVFDMLKRQPHRARFVGGLEAKLLTANMAIRLRELNPERLFFAYDTADDLEPLIQAGEYLFNAGFKRGSHDLRCYVLIGYKGDTFEKAERRLRQAWDAGFFPMAMLYRDKRGEYLQEWKQFQREWANPVITACKIKQ
ncbi:MAG: hypothetical protein LBQ39_07805 [Tannerellaceae bacterium]|jgi:hypothetical protein|nr:hypothetical protein [Tannerellaceae bacterium]